MIYGDVYAWGAESVVAHTPHSATIAALMPALRVYAVNTLLSKLNDMNLNFLYNGVNAAHTGIMHE